MSREYLRLRRAVQEQVPEGAGDDSEMRGLIYRTLAAEQKEQYIDVRERARLGKRIFDSLRGLDILQPLAEDEEVTDIMVNGPEDIFYEKKGVLRRLDERFESEERLREVIQQIVGTVNRSVNELSPIVDARLPDGSRVNAVFPPVAVKGPVLTVRRFRSRPLTAAELVAGGTLTAEAAEFLRFAVEQRYNVFVCGGTSSGKTTLLNVLSDFIPAGERVVTIEDTAELRLSGCANLVTLEARPGGREGAAAVPIRELIRASLRMRPDRIIVGEIRGDETIDMLQAMNSGHDGSLSTGHGNSCRDMLSRIETMVLMGTDIPLTAVRQQICSAIDLMVFLRRRRNGERRVEEIAQLTELSGGVIGLENLFELQEGELVRTSAELYRKKEWR